MRTAIPTLALLLLAACRSHPCGEAIADLPAPMSSLPLVHTGGQVCHAHGGAQGESVATATIMYWGEDTAELKDTYATALAGTAWAAVACANIDGGKVDRTCFEHGEQRLELHFEQSETGRLGDSFAAPSMKVEAYWTGPAEPSDDQQG